MIRYCTWLLRRTKQPLFVVQCNNLTLLEILAQSVELKLRDV